MIIIHCIRRYIRLPEIGIILTFLLGPVTAIAAPATFTFDDGDLWMSGEIDTSTPDDLLRALNAHPDVEWIVLEYVPGSNNDDANLIASRIVRQRGLNTVIPSGGLIASGGTDFFLAGKERIVERGACIGVHSWSDDDDPTPPTKLPRNHVAHQMFLEYYRELGIPEQFYWYTLKAATADGMHYMSETEIRNYGVATEFEGEEYWNLASCDSR